MDKAKFFASVRSSLFGGSLTAFQVSGMETLLAAIESARWPIAHAAYGLATALHETARTMQPIAEYGRGKGRAYGKPGKYGQAPYGRGYVQLTWDANYEKADRELGLKGALLEDFGLAMQAPIAAAIMVRGMSEGWFTGKRNADYLDKAPPDYLNARRIINGTDKAGLVADYAFKFETALRAAGYGVMVPVAWGDATAITHNGVTLEKPVPVPVEIELKPLPEAKPRVGFWASFLAILAEKLKGRRP